MKWLVTHFSGLGRRLLNLRDRPHAVAGGVAIGMFIGFTPLFGLKTLLCLGIAYILRCSPIAAVITVSLHDVVTPFWPVLLEIEYEIGHKLLSSPRHPVPEFAFHGLRWPELLQWTTFLELGLPLLVGSVFLSTPAAIVSYAGMFWFLKRREVRRGGGHEP